MNGWIKLHRKLLSWEWYGDINVSRLFIHLLLSCNQKDKKWRGLLIKKGSIITGRKKLSSETGLSEQQIRTCINKLTSTKELTIVKTSAGSMFTLNNWIEYQSINHQSTTNPTKHQPSTNQASTTTKEGKEYKERKEVLFMDGRTNLKNAFLIISKDEAYISKLKLDGLVVNFEKEFSDFIKEKYQGIEDMVNIVDLKRHFMNTIKLPSKNKSNEPRRAKKELIR